MNPILIKIGPIEIRWYSLCILLGVILAYYLISRESKKYKLPKDFMFNLTFYTVIFGLLGARIYYVIFNWYLYSHNPLSILYFWEGGLAIHGGLLAGIITMYLYCKKYKIRLIKITDIVAPFILLAQAIGRWGNFFNSEAHGPATTLATLKSHKIIPQFVIDGMNIDGIYYEPTFYYEFLWCILGLIIMIILRKKKNLKTGTLTAMYFIWYSTGRFFIESLRTDSLMFYGFKVAQLISILLFIIGLIIIFYNTKKSKFEDLYHDSNVEEIKL